MIRNFVYLDSDKLRSISSQLFEGVTEQVISTKSKNEVESEEQKGPVGSGRLLGNIFSQDKSSSELKFLEDYAYTIFEQKLLDDQIVSVVRSETTSLDDSKNFIKTTAKLRINDLAASAKTLADFNEIGEAFWRVTNESMLWQAEGNRIASDGEAKKRAGEAGMQFNQKVANSALKIVNYGFDGLLEANMVLAAHLFSAPLKREFLRETEQMILHKYSRISEIEFNMLGIITQRGSDAQAEENHPDVGSADGMKEAMRTLSLHLRTFERVFSAPSANEVIIDPIAIYSVL